MVYYNSKQYKNLNSDIEIRVSVIECKCSLLIVIIIIIISQLHRHREFPRIPHSYLHLSSRHDPLRPRPSESRKSRKNNFNKCEPRRS